VANLQQEQLREGDTMSPTIHFTAPINAFTAHRQRGITDRHMPRRRDEQHDYIRWCFAPLLRYSRRNFPAR
jgi:hypothetical protein